MIRSNRRACHGKAKHACNQQTVYDGIGSHERENTNQIFSCMQVITFK